MEELNKILEEIKDIYCLRNIIRYNNISRIKDETVAQHSFFTAIIVLWLYNVYEFDLQKALITALIHDVPEIWISDVPRNIKDKYKILDDALAEIENKVIQEKLSKYEKLLNDFNYSLSDEAKIVKFADTFSVMLYTNNEVKLGNTDFMLNVFNLVTKKLQVLLQEIDYMKRKSEETDAN